MRRHGSGRERSGSTYLQFHNNGGTNDSSEADVAATASQEVSRRSSVSSQQLSMSEVALQTKGMLQGSEVDGGKERNVSGLIAAFQSQC